MATDLREELKSANSSQEISEEKPIQLAKEGLSSEQDEEHQALLLKSQNKFLKFSELQRLEVHKQIE